MKLTIESMTYGADGLAHADNGKAVFVKGAVAGDAAEAEVERIFWRNARDFFEHNL